MTSILFIYRHYTCNELFAGRTPGFQLLEEVVALVINEDEGGEVFNGDLPDGFHTEFRIFYALDTLDAALRQDSSHTADGAEIEALVKDGNKLNQKIEAIIKELGE